VIDVMVFLSLLLITLWLVNLQDLFDELEEKLYKETQEMYDDENKSDK